MTGKLYASALANSNFEIVCSHISIAYAEYVLNTLQLFTLRRIYSGGAVLPEYNHPHSRAGHGFQQYLLLGQVSFPNVRFWKGSSDASTRLSSPTLLGGNWTDNTYSIQLLPTLAKIQVSTLFTAEFYEECTGWLESKYALTEYICLKISCYDYFSVGLSTKNCSSITSGTITVYSSFPRVTFTIVSLVGGLGVED